jgi:hypothetical protein
MQWAAMRRRQRRASWIRITITLSAKALEILGYVRNAQNSSASEAIDYLILKTDQRELQLKAVGGITTFDREDDGPLITNEDVQCILDEEYVHSRKAQKPTPRRTSVAISSEALAILKQLRETNGISISKAVSELVEKNG